MRPVDALNQIRPDWISAVSQPVAGGDSVWTGSLDQLTGFYDSLLQAVETGDPACIQGILAVWIESRLQSELEDGRTGLLPLLNRLQMATVQAARENLRSREANGVISAVLPVYAHAFDFLARRETDLYVDRVSSELEEASLSLERLDRSKSDFISIAAHELKTPLTLIEGYADMLRDLIAAGADAVQASILLKGINTGTRRLREIVDDMIDVSMIDNQLLSLSFQPVWINQLFKVIQQEFKDSIRDRSITLEIRPFPGSREHTFGDAERLYQAFRNLVSNAIKYTPNDGKVTIDGRLLPGFIEITVADTGIGIDPEDHDRIFEKFGRLGSTSLHSSGKTKYKGGGPGLGLPITKGIIEAHGGAIWVESEGQDEVNYPGTIFHILLPLRKEPPDEKMARLFRAAVDTGEPLDRQTSFDDEFRKRGIQEDY